MSQLIPIVTVILIIVFLVVRFKLHVHLRKGLPGFVHGLGLMFRRLPAGFTDARLQLQDSEVAYLSGGKGQDVIFLHDFGGEKDDWVPAAGKLRGYKRWIPDLPGFGESPPSPNHRYDFVSQVRRLGGFIQRNSIQRCHLVGVGMGGAIAGIYASVNAAQVTTLTLIEPMGIDAKLKTDIEGLTARGWSPLTAGNEREWERLLKTLYVKPPSFGLGRKRHLRQQAEEYKREHDRIWKEIHKDRPYLLEQILPEIKVPTLVITGDSAKIFHPSAVKHLEEGLPDVTVKLIKGVGHWPMVERPKEAAKLIAEFLKPRS